MNTESTIHEAAELSDTLASRAKPLIKSSRESCQAFRSEAGDFLACASERIRQNPVPAVAGAVAFGIAVGCLIMSGRHTATASERFISEPLEDAGDAISASLGRLFGNLKFW